MIGADTHPLAITHIPLDGGGTRLSGSIAGIDVNLDYLVQVLTSHADDMAKTETALRNPATHDLAEAVRAALIGIQSIAYHLIEVHDGIANGNLNFYEEPVEARTRFGV